MRSIVIKSCDGYTVRLVSDVEMSVHINDLEEFLISMVNKGYHIDEDVHCYTCFTQPVGNDCILGSIFKVLYAKYPSSVSWVYG